MPVVTPLFTDGIDKPKDKPKTPVVEQKKPDDLKKYLDDLLTSVTDIFKKKEEETPVVAKPPVTTRPTPTPPVVTTPPVVAKPPVVVAPPVVTRPITPTPPVVAQPPVVSTPPALPEEPKKPAFDYAAV